MGALEADEHRQVKRQLLSDPELQRDLSRLQAILKPLECDRQHYEPPPGLAARTCVLVERKTRTVIPMGGWSHRSSWHLQDFMVAAGIVIAATLLFFPAVNQSRFQAQIASCQNNLRQIGAGLMNYSQLHAGFFPYVPPAGRFSSPGIYATTLSDGGFLTDRQPFFCPSSEVTCEQQCHIPSAEEVRQATEQQLARLHQRLGGSYSSTYGYVEGGRYQGTRNLGRPHFALVADSPCQKLGERQSSNHGGHGQNVLFEDGHVVFLSECNYCPHSGHTDDIYRNDDGLVAAGKHVNDSVISYRALKPAPASGR